MFFGSSPDWLMRFKGFRDSIPPRRDRVQVKRKQAIRIGGWEAGRWETVPTKFIRKQLLEPLTPGILGPRSLLFNIWL